MGLKEDRDLSDVVSSVAFTQGHWEPCGVSGWGVIIGSVFLKL